MRSFFKKISVAALVFVGAITLTNARQGDFCVFDGDCPDLTEVCLSNSCEKVLVSYDILLLNNARHILYS